MSRAQKSPSVGRLVAVAVEDEPGGHEVGARCAAPSVAAGRAGRPGRRPGREPVGRRPGRGRAAGRGAASGVGRLSVAVDPDDGLAAVLGHDHPGGVRGGAGASGLTRRWKRPRWNVARCSRVEGDLVADLGPLVVGQRGRIQLVAEDAEHRHGGARRERRDPAGLVVGHGRHVGAHRAERVDERGPPLDGQPLDGVGVVARPGLRGEGQHARDRTARRRCARLEQDVGEALGQAPVQLVHAEDVAVGRLALAVRRESTGVRLGDRAVHVPLDVARSGRWPRTAAERPSARWSTTSGRPRSRTSWRRLSVGARPGDADGPVGVGAVQVAVRG